MTAPLSLSAIRAMHAAITPGPWQVDEGEIRDEDFVNVVGTVWPHGAATRQLKIAPNDAAFIAAAPSTVERLLGIVDDILAIKDIGMNSEHGDPAFIQGWECALEEMKARIESDGKES